jgi:hypothetical protein
MLDWGARIGAAARRDNVKASQLENMIAAFESFTDPKASLLGVAAFALRQAERLGSGRTMARLVVRAMEELYNKGCSKEEGRKILGFAKWIFEALREYRGDVERLTIEQVLNEIAKFQER